MHSFNLKMIVFKFYNFAICKMYIRPYSFAFDKKGVTFTELGTSATSSGISLFAT
jgi:hypothetical protein